MSDAAKIGLAYPARRKHTYSYLLFRSINKDCFTPEGDIDYPRVIISHGTIARVDIISVKINATDNPNHRTVTITFAPCLQSSNAIPDDELYFFAYCPTRCEGVLYEPVPRIVSAHTITLPSNSCHLYAFLRCPGPTANTPQDARAAAKNRRGQTSSTIYIPLP